MIKTDIDIYRSYIENESISYSMYFTYDPSPDEVIERLEQILMKEVHVYDTFPEPNSESLCLEYDLSAMSTYGVAINIQKGTNISLFDTFRILFGDKDEL